MSGWTRCRHCGQREAYHGASDGTQPCPSGGTMFSPSDDTARPPRLVPDHRSGCGDRDCTVESGPASDAPAPPRETSRTVGDGPEALTTLLNDWQTVERFEHPDLYPPMSIVPAARESFPCGCVRDATWARCADHRDLSHHKTPPVPTGEGVVAFSVRGQTDAPAPPRTEMCRNAKCQCGHFHGVTTGLGDMRVLPQCVIRGCTCPGFRAAPTPPRMIDALGMIEPAAASPAQEATPPREGELPICPACGCSMWPQPESLLVFACDEPTCRNRRPAAPGYTPEARRCQL